MVFGAIGSALIGGLGGLIGGNKQSKDARYAADRSAETARLGFDYLRGSPVASYMQPGANANNAIASLLGVGGGAGGGAPQADNAATLAKIRSGLQGWSAAKPGNAEPIMQMIDSGASLSDVQGALTRLRGTTTHASNTAHLDPLIQQANNPIMGQAPAGDPNAANNAFQNYLNSTGYQFQLGEGQRAVTGSAAARGGLNSGSTLKALNKYGQNLASTTFDNYLNQLRGVSQAGLQAGGMIGGAASGAGQTGAGMIGQGYSNAADARAQGFGGLVKGAGEIFQSFANRGGQGDAWGLPAQPFITPRVR